MPSNPNTYPVPTYLVPTYLIPTYLPTYHIPNFSFTRRWRSSQFIVEPPPPPANPHNLPSKWWVMMHAFQPTYLPTHLPITFLNFEHGFLHKTLEAKSIYSWISTKWNSSAELWCMPGLPSYLPTSFLPIFQPRFLPTYHLPNLWAGSAEYHYQCMHAV